ncbi:HPP family protein [Tumidithrix elongata]
MSQNRFNSKPITSIGRSLRQHLSLKEELLLAIAPTLTIAIVMAFVETVSQQRLLFASLAASAFLIYLDPHHSSNTARTLILSQLMAAAIGWFANFTCGAGYVAGIAAMVATIVFTIALDVVHPPAVSTSLSFALQTSSQNNFILFSLAVGAIALLVGLERLALRILTRFH